MASVALWAYLCWFAEHVRDDHVVAFVDDRQLGGGDVVFAVEVGAADGGVPERYAGVRWDGGDVDVHDGECDFDGGGA